MSKRGVYISSRNCLRIATMAGRGHLTHGIALGVFFVCLFIHPAEQASDRPHILVIMTDDMGWNDVAFRDSEMYTPNIDKMASEGVSLNYSYMLPVCTPSRAAFLSGHYPFRMGLQHSVLSAMQNASMPLQYELFPQQLQSLGYKTHMVGKWHLGFCDLRMTPTYRGFDTYYGMYNGKADFYKHESKRNGYDMHHNIGQGEDRNFTVTWSDRGTYSTHLFTDKTIEVLENHNQSQPVFIFLSYQAVHGPLQVPQYYVDKYCANVTTGDTRKLHCAMTAAMDEGIGNVTDALDRLGFSDNLITLFVSDNGGPVKLGSSNWPLRGSKITLWEGGTRVVTILRSKKYLPNHAGYVWDGLMHAVDWYPTLMRAAGFTGDISGIDGVDNWGAIVNKTDSNREEFVYNINDVKKNSALRYRNYKLVKNKAGSPDAWYNPPAGVANRPEPSGRYPKFMLFDIDQDPEETTDIRKQELKTLRLMKKKLNAYSTGLKRSVKAKKVKAGNPKFHNGAWVSDWC